MVFQTCWCYQYHCPSVARLHLCGGKVTFYGMLSSTLLFTIYCRSCQPLIWGICIICTMLTPCMRPWCSTELGVLHTDNAWDILRTSRGGVYICQARPACSLNKLDICKIWDDQLIALSLGLTWGKEYIPLLNNIFKLGNTSTSPLSNSSAGIKSKHKEAMQLSKWNRSRSKETCYKCEKQFVIVLHLCNIWPAGSSDTRH